MYSMRRVTRMQETVRNMGRVLEWGRIDSENTIQSSSIYFMNRTIRMVEVGAHIDRERTGATGKPERYKKFWNWIGNT